MAMTRLAPELFDLVIARTRMHKRTVRAARSVLVDGLSTVEAARIHGMQRQDVGRAVGKARRAIAKDFGVCPTCGTKMEKRNE